MTDNCDLTKKHCVPCQGGVPALTEKEIEPLLTSLGNTWKINSLGHLTKTFTYDDFMKPMTLANNIATIAEAEGHHPDLTIAWGKCSVTIWTHKINGLTESDFILAAKIDDLK